jgi:hypothetical protein
MQSTDWPLAPLDLRFDLSLVNMLISVCVASNDSIV